MKCTFSTNITNKCVLANERYSTSCDGLAKDRKICPFWSGSQSKQKQKE